MLVYILRRLVLAASVVFAAITLVFVIFFVGPSDPAAALCGKNCTVARVAQINATLGLNQPAITQFAHYLQGLFVGRDISSGGVTSHCGAPCLGWSFYQNTSVTKLVEQAFPVTLSIVAGAALIFVVTGLTLGILAAKYRGTWIDRLLVGTSQVIASVPYYVLALLFFLYTMVVHSIFPSSGYTPITQDAVAWFKGFIGVWIIFGVINGMAYVRYIRAFMINTMNQDYVRTARAKGIGESKVLVGHAFRATAAPLLTLVGLDLAVQMGGAVFTEAIFQLPGMGLLALNSLGTSDLPTIAGVVVVTSIIVVLGNLIVDLLYVVVDPRVSLA